MRRSLLLFGMALFFFIDHISAQVNGDAVTVNLRLDGSKVYQSIDGFGVNANTRSWDSVALRPALDLLLDSMHATVWRVVVETVEKWEETNDNNDPFTFNWEYYNKLYKTPKFRKAFEMMRYLNRRGITENFYVQGHLAYWDALLAMNPKLRIDSCASGGRRNDLETMRRGVPFTRSDFQFPEMPNCVDGNQCHTWALSSWLPYQGSGCRYYDTYGYRSFYMAEYGMCAPPTPENTKAQQKSYAECKQIAPIMTFGDYYPLTGYDLGHKVWMAWQFDRPENGDGVVQAGVEACDDGNADNGDRTTNRPG